MAFLAKPRLKTCAGIAPVLMLALNPVSATAQQTKSALSAINNSYVTTNGRGTISGALLNADINNVITSMCGLAQAADCVLPSGVAPANIGNIGSGHVFGNGTGVSATGSDTSLINVINQSGSGLATGFGAAAASPLNASGGFGVVGATSTVTSVGTGSVPSLSGLTCAMSGTFGATGNPACQTVTTNIASGTIGYPTAAIFLTNLNATSGNARGGYYVPLETQVTAYTTDGGWQTTLSGSATTGATSLSVSSTSGILSGDYVYVVLTNGQLFSTVAGTPGAGTIPISPSLPSGASNGAAVYGNKGVLQGAILQSSLGASATKFFAAIGATAAVYTTTGVSPLYRAGLSVENDTPSGSQGSIVDTLISVTGQSGVSTTFQTGIEFSDISGSFPVQSSGSLISAKSIYQTTWPVTNDLDFSGILTTGYFAKWSDSVGVSHSIAGDGTMNVGTSTFAANNVSAILNDKAASSTGGGLVRITGDGAGNFVFQQNTAVANNFSTSTSVFKVTSGGIFQVLTSLALTNAAAYAATTNCGSLASSTKCIAIIDPNGNTLYVPAYGTY